MCQSSHWVFAPHTSQIPLTKNEYQVCVGSLCHGDNTHRSEDKRWQVHVSPLGHCVHQGVALGLFWGYLTFPFNLEVSVEIVDTFPRTPGVRQTQPQGFSKAVSIGLCLPDIWIDSRVIGNIHHSLP